MKKLFITGAVALLAICFYSCKTPMAQFSMASYRPVTGVGVVNVPTLADLEVSQTKLFEKLEVKIDEEAGSEAIESAVNTTLAALLLKHNADVLIQPVWYLEKRTANRWIISVSGYPATYKNFRPMSKEDAVMFKDVEFQHVPNGVVVGKVSNEERESTKKKR
ncbi:MAG: hypothetical protein LBG80_15970 [Bacteroidales bacterium]|jgi:hypothetical protein|nr:hypothetical protein [Bacteroidales bacterium]